MRPSSSIPQSQVDVLLLAAHAPELVGLRAQLGENLIGFVRGLTVVAKTVGVGMAVAGAGAANRIHQLNPRSVVLLGSCGIYPCKEDYRPLDIVVARSCHLLDPSAEAGKAAFPGPMQTALDTDPGLSAGLQAAAGERARQVKVANTLAITIDDAVARAVQPATGFQAENLEIFPIALACRAADIPFGAVLGVTNMVGSTGRVDWQQFQRDAALLTAEVSLRWLQAGAVGLPPRAAP
jgi:nucleoside phosphorylase